MKILHFDSFQIRPNEKKKNVFLNNLIECGGNIGRAAAKSNITRQTHYNWLKEDDRYAAVYENDVKPQAVSALEDEALRRAMGYEEDVYFQGKKTGTVTKYSDRLMELLLKANNPEKYRERAEIKTSSDDGKNTAEWEEEADG